MQWWTLFFYASASAVTDELSEFTESLKGMAFWAAWGAANDRSYGKGFASWEHQWAKALSALEDIRDVIEDENVVNQLHRMSLSAAWGAANERAYGKLSDSQVDWTMNKQHVAKLKEIMPNILQNDKKLCVRNDNDNPFIEALETGSLNAAWWAANSQNYSSAKGDAATNEKKFEDAMSTVQRLAPKKWKNQSIKGGTTNTTTVQAIQELFNATSWSAASHRAADLSRKRFMEGEDQQPRGDWQRYEEHSERLKKYLGSDMRTLYEHLDAMAITAAWGATDERAYGRRAYDAQSNWGRFKWHKDRSAPNQNWFDMFKAPMPWDDIAEMMRAAAWGAANERAYGKESQEASSAWSHFEDHAAKVLAAAVPAKNGKHEL